MIRMAVEIPESLRDKEFRFIKIKPNQKVPLENGWQNENNYSWNDPEFERHLKSDGNYGILCGYNYLVVIDADSEKVSEKVREKLPDTFTVKSGGGGFHFYYKCKDLEKPIRLSGDNPGELGDVQSRGKQVIGPTSVHPEGDKYEVVRDREIAKVDKDELISALLPFISENDLKTRLGNKERDNDIEKFKSKIDVSNVIEEYVTRKRKGSHYWQGICPFHSDNNPSFTVYSDNYYCFGCGASGDVIDFIREKEDLDFLEAVERIGEITGVEIPEFGVGSENEVSRFGEIEDLVRVEVRITEVYRSGRDTRGDLQVRIDDNEYLEENQKVSRQNIRTLCNDIQDVENLSDEQVNEIFSLFAPLKTEVIKKAKKNSSKKKNTDDSESDDCSFDLLEDKLEEANREAEEILDSEQPLKRIKDHLDNIIAGEEKNKQFVFVNLLSGKVPSNEMKTFITAKGGSGGGKSTLSKIADFFETKDVGRFTAHALDYSDLEDYDILRIKELGDMDQEFQGVSTIKFLSSDDEGYKVEYSVRDESTGEMTTETHRIPPITLITSTTKIELDEQFGRRSWIVSPDESRDQTKRIGEFKAEKSRQEAEVDLGKREVTDYDYSQEVLSKVVDNLDLENVKVHVPFMDSIFKILNNENLRVRGDYDKVENFIKLYTLFHKRARPKISGNRKEVIFSTPEDAVEALKLASGPLKSMFGGIDRRIRKTLYALEEIGIDKFDSITKERRKELGENLDRSERTIRRYLDRLAEKDYAIKLGGGDSTREVVYKLLYDIEEIKSKIEGVFGHSEMPGKLLPQLAKKGRKYVESLLDNDEVKGKREVLKQFEDGSNFSALSGLFTIKPNTFPPTWNTHVQRKSRGNKPSKLENKEHKARHSEMSKYAKT